MKIADLIKDKRKLLGESQEQFAKRFGLSHAAISDIENGKTKSIDEEMLNFVMPTGFYGKSIYEVKAEVIYDLITSGELDRNESIATLALNLDPKKGKEDEIDWSIDVRYEPDPIKAFNKFIKKWCGSHFSHLIDTDQQDGQFMREKIEALMPNNGGS